MRILVIDDTFDAKLAIADVLRDTGHLVEGAYDPDVLPRLLAEEAPFDLALVDMVFAGCARSGLGALRMLREFSPGTKTVVRCSDDEANRQLHLLAAFTLFTPVALVSRGEDPRALVPLLDAVEHGEPVASGVGRYQHHGPPPAPLDELLGNKTDLAVWQALTRFDRRPDIARAAYVSPATVDHFIAGMYPVVEKLRLLLGDAAEAPGPGQERARDHRGHNAPLIQLAYFARLFREFFRDTDLGPLLEQRWARRRRNPSQASAAVRRAMPRNRRHT
jgi:DNA-binding NarL/FixJ family response regulator